MDNEQVAQAVFLRLLADAPEPTLDQYIVEEMDTTDLTIAQIQTKIQAIKLCMFEMVQRKKFSPPAGAHC